MITGRQPLTDAKIAVATGTNGAGIKPREHSWNRGERVRKSTGDRQKIMEQIKIPKSLQNIFPVRNVLDPVKH